MNTRGQGKAKWNIQKAISRLEEMERNGMWLSRKVGVSSKTAYAWLSGDYSPSIGNLKRIAEVLGLEWQDLVV